MPELPPLTRKVDNDRRKAARLQRLAATHALLERVRAEHALAFTAAVRACSLAEVAGVLGMTRAGVQHHRRALKAGRKPRPVGSTTTREAE